MKHLEFRRLEDFDFKDKNVFMRVDFNVPIQDKQVLDTYRIEKTMRSIQFILDKGGRLLLASHLGRPKGQVNSKLSLKPAARYLSEKQSLEVLFVEEPNSLAPKALLPGLKKNQLILLENLRFHPGEEKRDKDFAKHLASYTDIYINEGFGISHRNHTSVTLLPEQVSQKGLGLQFEAEIEKLDKIKNCQIRQPFLMILGGSKLRDKIPFMESLIDQTDEFLIGGLMAYTFLKAMGKDVGSTPVEKESLFAAEIFMGRLKQRGKKIQLPVDHVVELKGKVEVWNHQDLPKSAIGRDIGPATLKLFQEEIFRAKSIFWNGPMGFYEKECFRSGTQGLATTLAHYKEAYRLVGGGHSALAVREFESELDHVSTGGGASLYYLQDKVLPGLKSLLTPVASKEGRLREE